MVSCLVYHQLDLLNGVSVAACGLSFPHLIASMVDGLAQRLARDGSDLDGWLKLARARLVLGEPDKAQDALDRASALFAGNAQALARIEELRQEIGKAVP